MQVLCCTSRVFVVVACALACCSVVLGRSGDGKAVEVGHLVVRGGVDHEEAFTGFAVDHLPGDGWSILSDGADPARALHAQPSIELLGQQMLDAGLVGYTAPMLIDEEGARGIPTGSILLAFDPMCSAHERAQIVRALDNGLNELVPVSGKIFRLETGYRNGFDVMALADALDEHEMVRYAHPDYLHLAEKSFVPNDPLFHQDWSLRNIGQSGGTGGIDLGASAAWDTTIGATDVRILVLDDGVQQSHPDLHQIPGMDFTFSPSSQGDGRPVESCDSHGTRVAGRVSATVNNSLGGAGVAPGCTVVSGRVFVSDDPPCSNTGLVQDSWVIEALAWGTRSGIRISNTSLKMSFSPAVEDAYQEARDAGVLHFASSGNAGLQVVDYPARYPSVIAVGSINRDGQAVISSNHGADLDLVAPGSAVITTDPSGSAGGDPGDFDVVSGTSYAAPGAAGVAALGVTAADYVSPDMLRDAMMGSAQDLGVAGVDNIYGAGLVRAPNTMSRLPVPARAYFVGLGYPVAGSGFSRPLNIARDGSMVVGEMRGQFRVAFYHSASSANLPLVLDTGETATGIAYSAADNGQAVVGRYDAPLGDRAFIYRPEAGLQDLGVLSSVPGSFSTGYDCSRDASVVVGESLDKNTDIQAVRWTQGGGMVGLGFLSQSAPFLSKAHAVDAAGERVVGESASGFGTHAFVWDAVGQIRPLIDLPSKTITASSALDISSDGLVVVGRIETAAGTYAARWGEAGVVEILGDLEGGQDDSQALSTNRDGSVVVGEADDGSGLAAFIWAPIGGMRLMSEYITLELGLDISGWRLLSAQGVSDDGMTIVGEGLNPQGIGESWLLRLPTLPAPFELITPSDGATGIATGAFFQWHPSAHTESYELQVDDDSDFGSPVLSTHTALTSISFPSGTLERGTRYSWRVIASSGAGETVSVSREFITVGEPPISPLLVLPSDAGIVDTTTPEFLWVSSGGAKTYSFTLFSHKDEVEPLFHQALDPQLGPIQRFTLPVGVAEQEGVYIWGVVAGNAVGSTASTPESQSFAYVPSPLCAADADGSGAVDSEDIVFVLEHLGGKAGGPADTNRDGAVDVNDITYVLFRLGPCGGEAVQPGSIATSRDTSIGS